MRRVGNRSIRMFIVGTVASCAVFGAALLAAFAQDFRKPARDRCTAIDIRDLDHKAIDPPTQPIDGLI